MRRGALDFVDQAQDVGDGHVAEAGRQRPPILARGGQRAEEPISRTVLAEEQELVLAAEIVIEVAWGEIRGDGDVAHAGGGEAARPKHPRRRAHDLHAAGVGSD